MSDISQSSELNVKPVLIDLVNKHITDEQVAISLSSGIDSVSVLFALLECNKIVTVYSFTLEDRESRDFKEARQLAQKLNLQFVPILLPTSINTLKDDCIKLHKKYGCVKKTDYVCTWPYLYLTKEVKQHTLATGMAADGHFVISKKGMINYKDNVVEFRKKYFSNPTRCQLPYRTALANEYDIKLFEPYLKKEMFEYLLYSTWDECNKPNQKMPIRRAFPDMYEKYIKIHNHTNFQLGDSGIAEHFEKLLQTDWNIHNYKSVVGVFNTINRGELNGRRKLI